MKCAGIGERLHLVSPQVDLTTHVHDLVHHIMFEGLRDIVHVGYSYGGAVATAALEHIGDCVRELSISTRSCPATDSPLLTSRDETGQR